tara:strand:+ start:249 stop:524 length:276 start_codon:yes stop_codon:yes gene_type:complete
MYGAIFDVVRDLVITNFGHPAWIDLAAKADLPPEIPISDVLPEEKFENLVMCACEVSDTSKCSHDSVKEIVKRVLLTDLFVGSQENEGGDS